MAARARTRALTALAALAFGITLTTVPPAFADEIDPQAPVVVDDEITLWPGEFQDLNVLANDSDPAGDDLALCRLPPVYGESDDAPVSAYDRSPCGGQVGELRIWTEVGVQGTHTIEYYVCNHTRLTPATLTVKVRPVVPVEVTTVTGKPGRLRVTNDNDQPIRFLATDKSGCMVDARGRVEPHAVRTFRVHRHTVSWMARIGRGIAGLGTVRHVELHGPAAPPGDPYTVCFPRYGRYLAEHAHQA